MEKRTTPTPVIRSASRTVWLPLLILLLAAGLRLYRLDAVPPGLTHDEANNVYDAASVLRGARPAYFPVAQGKEPLYLYNVALTMALLGPTPFAMRLTSAWWGLLLVALTYAWARRAFDRPTALWTATGLALSFWGVSTSRLGLRAITLPALFTAALLALVADRRWTTANRRPLIAIRYLLPGLFLGLTLYTYLAARLLPAIPLLFGLYLLLTDRQRWWQRWRPWGVSLLIAALVAAPLFAYLQAHPSAEIRIGQLDQPLRLLLKGDPGPLMAKIYEGLHLFSLRGDGFIPYNIPGRPLLDPLTSLLFYAGLLIALRRWREPAHALALLWLVVGFFPALATGVDAAHLRAIAAQPVLYLFPALTLERLRTGGPGRAAPRLAVPILVLLAFAPVAFLTLRDYFLRWPNDRDVRVHYHVDLMAIAEAVRRGPEEEPVAISSFYPGQYHDPRILQAVLGEAGPPLRWFDGRQALYLPPASAARLILPQAVPLDDALWALVRPHATLLERVELRPDDFDPAFAIYRWSPEETLAALQPRLEAPLRPDRQPVAVGASLTFLGYRLQGEPSAGQTLLLLTLWQVEAPLPPDRDAVLFTQLLDGQNQVVAQQDRLDAPSWQWQPGDRFLQLHRLTLPADLPPGTYTLITGVYTVPDRVDAVLAGHEPDPAIPRLTVYVEGKPVDDHLTLRLIEVR